jgi:ABC-2 type transport system ATP-binding protein
MTAITFDNVSKWYSHRPAFFNLLGKERGGRTEALRSVSLTVPAGQVIAVLGPNGSGKTTLLKLACGYLLPDGGAVTVNGADTGRRSRLRDHIAFVTASERSFFPRLTATENLDYFAAFENIPRPLRKARVARVLRSTRLEEQADVLTMKFSSGMVQRLAIARGLLTEPKILVLDEPSKSLDPAATAHFWEIIRNMTVHGGTVLFSTHSFEEAVALSARALILRRGELIADIEPAAPDGLARLQAEYAAVVGPEEAS